MSLRGRPASYLLAASSGLLQVLVFPRFGFSFLAFFAVTPLLLALEREPAPRSRFFLGWLAGAVFWGGTCYWIYDVMHRYADLSALAAAAIFAGFFVVKGLYLGVFSLAAGPLLSRSWAIPAVAAAWVAIEGSQQYLAFTWLQLGNAGTDFSLAARLAPYTGIYGVSFVLAMVNVAVALAVWRRPRRDFVWLAALLILFLVPALPEAIEGAQTVRLVQPNVHPDEVRERRWTLERHTRHLERMAFLSTEGAEAIDPTPASLLVWPEYTVPAYYSADARFRDYIRALAQRVSAPVVFNSIEFTSGNPRHPLNSALTVNAAGELVSQYDKIFRVPFGEFVPWPFSLFVHKITLEAGDFAPGREVVVTEVNGRRVGTFVCYESVFARGVRRFVVQGAEVLLNISNDSWYGRTAARHQHLLIARMRAMENARWLLRATSDGITSVIDPGGRITASLPSFEEGVLCARFDYSSKMTWFTRFGQWFWGLTLCATLASLIIGHVRPLKAR